MTSMFGPDLRWGRILLASGVWLLLQSAAWCGDDQSPPQPLPQRRKPIRQNNSQPSSRVAGNVRAIERKPNETANEHSAHQSSRTQPGGIQPGYWSFLKRACTECHGADAQEGNIRVDTLDPNLHSGKDVDWWTEVFAVINKGEMPPPDSTELTDSDRAKIVEWLSTELQAASIARRQSASHSAFRRLTKYETNYASKTCWGCHGTSPTIYRPMRSRTRAFANSSELLHMSVAQFETLHRIARSALSRAIVTGEQPKTLYWGVTMKEASRLEWPKQAHKLEEAKKKFKDEPEKLDAELKRLEKSFRQVTSRSHYRDLASGQTVAATWEYDSAKYANAPRTEPIPIPTMVETIAILRPVSG